MTANWTEETRRRQESGRLPTRQSRTARFGMLFLHGYGLETLRDNPVYTRLFEQLQVPVRQSAWPAFVVGRSHLRANSTRP